MLIIQALELRSFGVLDLVSEAGRERLRRKAQSFAFPVSCLILNGGNGQGQDL